MNLKWELTRKDKDGYRRYEAYLPSGVYFYITGYVQNSYYTVGYYLTDKKDSVEIIASRRTLKHSKRCAEDFIIKMRKLFGS